jgi:putative hemolysin
MAELFRFGTSVDKRTLSDEASLPPPILVGTALGYPVVSPQFLISQSTGKCLTHTLLGLAQRTCNPGDAGQHWGMMDVLAPTSPNFVLTGTRTNICLSDRLLMGACLINLPEHQWSSRTDLAQPEHILLQNRKDGRFITAAADGRVTSGELSQSADQNFQRTGLDGVSSLNRIESTTTRQCLARVEDRIVEQRCSDAATQQWRIGKPEEDGTATGSRISMVSPDGGYCIQDGMRLAACDTSAVDQHWTGPTGELPAKLMNLASGKFIGGPASERWLNQTSRSEESQAYVFRRLTFSKTLRAVGPQAPE